MMPGMGEQKTVLIIDDDPDIQEAMCLPLEVQGYKVVVATNGEEGLAKVLECAPDLIILDIMMFTPTEGFHVAYQLRSDDPDSPYLRFRKVPILIVTAIHQATTLRFHFDGDEDFLPADEFIEKPIEPAILLEKVGKFLGAE
jgi:two-component system alkaline phosphatase synthesis response regulator PhoP